MFSWILVAATLSLAAPTDPCTQPATFWDGQSASSDLSGASFDWDSRTLNWKELKPRFKATEQRTLLHGANIRVEAVLGTDEVAIVVGRRQSGDWCATATWHEYFGGKGLEVKTLQAVSVAGAYLVLLDGTGLYSSPPGATERISKLAAISFDGVMGKPVDALVEAATADTLEVARGSNGEPRLLVRGSKDVAVYKVGRDADTSLVYRLPGPDVAAREVGKQLVEVCGKVRVTKAAHPEINFVAMPQAFEGRLERIGKLRHPTENDEGAVLELTFKVTGIYRDVGSLLTVGGRHDVVVPLTSILAEDILLAGLMPDRCPASCLFKLGLPDTPKPGRSFLVAAHETWEAEQAALPPRQATKEERARFEKLAREAAFVDHFKASFAPTDGFNITDQGETFEITVTHPSSGDSTGGAEQYILDKQSGEWKMGWHEHPMPNPGWK